MKNNARTRAVLLAFATFLSSQAVCAQSTAADEPALPKQKLGLWEISAASSDSHNGKTFQLCLTGDAASQAKMAAYLGDARQFGITDGVEISNRNRTGRSLSYNLTWTGETIQGTGMHAVIFPDSKHRTMENAFRGIMSGVAIDRDEVTTLTWIKDNCDGVKPVDGTRP